MNIGKKILLSGSVILCCSCSTWGKLNKTERGAVIGAGSGALIGGAVGNGTGALIGGAAGGVTGGVIGNEMDKDDRRDRRY